MSKDKILSEIRRTAAENNGVALGRERFSKETGISASSWRGKYWERWSDAIKEAGLVENLTPKAHETDFLIESLALLTRKLERFPTYAALRMEKISNNAFPNHTTFHRLGDNDERISLVRKLATSNKNFNDILQFLPQHEEGDEITVSDSEENCALKEGSVYMLLLKIGKEKRYKIGKSILVERRQSEVSIALPEDTSLVHEIRTDDAYGIEAYWHKRFNDKRTKGEWFKLTLSDVQAFKKRKFM